MDLRVYLDTLGCRLNESEIEMMGRAFTRLGHEIVRDPEQANLFVINTCAVTNEAGKKSRQMIRWAHKKSPDAQIIVTGCYSEIERPKVEAMPGVVRVVGNAHKDRLVPDLLGISDEEWMDQEPLARELNPGELRRTRAFVKAQDGCDNRCTFCVTTIARGQGRSRPLGELLEEVNALYQAGYQEVVLSGVHLGSYGKDLQEDIDVRGLVQAFLDQTDFPRIRLSSLEPWDIPEGFFDLWHNPRLCQHLHMPLQAGCDRTLKRMARRTRVEAFRDLVNQARAVMPSVGISSDIIVGFPGETDEDFQESLAFTEEMDFCHLHIFRYSPRPGTAAATMPNQVDGNKKSERSAAMHVLATQGRISFDEKHLGETLDVLWEQQLEETPEGIWWQGLTSNYIKVKTLAPRPLHNLITPVRLESRQEDGTVLGTLI
ncbi:MAG: tRNA (N(6)-L-threonylcarbamoyladenosine(37)-C(2))-methylthiotransferase MtaB [Deltaproteobacteria bacterium]|nr:MAG: tRNA (N(6)-L-threonylcarbamoyladenosine(37)-C(2))-methylthiotransferase MtaB [Deltaproteobacteria bacterium]